MERLSYLHSADNEYTSGLSSISDPCKNLNEVFQSVSIEDVDVEKLRVYLRVRPSLLEERLQDKDTEIEILDNQSIILTAPASSNTFRNSNHGITKLSQKFTFSHIYGPSTTQKQLFETSTLGLVKDLLYGQNCLLFTYGATNSGKTYTVQGTPTDAGILPRTLDIIFNSIGERQYPKNDLKPRYFCSVQCLNEKDIQKEEERKEKIFKISSELNSASSHSVMSLSKLSTSDESLNSSQALTEVSRISHPLTEVSRASSLMESQFHDDTSLDVPDTENTLYAIFVSFAEIYNEYIYDLLEKMPTSKKGKRNPLMLGEDRNAAIYIKELQEVRVRSAEEAWRLLQIGRQNLHFAATRLNHNSSRSHCIFTIKIIKVASADSPHVARVSMLSVCDLAGAERAGKTLSTHDRLKEAGSINTSILVLSRCIEALRRNQMQKGGKKREIPVPYRDSKLTRLFQSFFLGRGKAAMIVNISKTPFLFDETLQVLKFAAIAKQVAISQAEPPCRFQAPKRISQFTKFVRQSFNTSGRLSVPWMKCAGDVTFGASEGIREEESINTIEEEDEQSERFEALVQLISRLKEELVKEHKEKVELEENLREELCAEFSQQIVEIENSWSQRLKDQQARSEELTEWKLHALMKSAKKLNSRKRLRPDYDPDEEYVPSLLLFQEQHKVQEQSKYIGELETELKHLKAEAEALKNSQKKTSERATKAQEENSKLTFQLAQLTHNFDKVTKELEETIYMNESSKGTEDLVIHELQSRVDQKKLLLEMKDSEIKELKEMLLEAAEVFIAKDQECESQEKKLEMNEKTITKQLMNLNEMESQLEDTRAMLSQHAAQLEERDQHIAEVQAQLVSQNVEQLGTEVTDLPSYADSCQTQLRVLEKKLSWMQQEQKDCCKKLEKVELEKQEIEEEYLRDKSKLLLELSELKCSKAQTIPSDSNTLEDFIAAELRATQFQQEKQSLLQERECLNNKLTESDMLFSHLQSANSQLEKEYAVLEKERDQLKDSVSELSNKLISVQEDRASEQLDTSAIKATGVNAMNQINTLQKELSEKEARITSLHEQVLHLQLQVNELTKSKHSCLQEFERNYEKMKENIISLEGKLNGSEMDKAQYEGLREKFNQLSEKLQDLQGENENMREERDHLKDKMQLAEENSKLKIIDEDERIKSLENKITQMEDSLTRREIEMEAIKEEKETKIASLEKAVESMDSLSKKLCTEKEYVQHQLNQEILTKNSEIVELESNHKTLKMELEKVHCTLESKIESELLLRELSNSKDAEIEKIISELKCQKSLEEENVLLKLKYEEQKVEQEKLRSDIESEKKINMEIISEKGELQDQMSSKDKELDKLHAVYEDMKRELQESNKVLARYGEEISEKQAMDKLLLDLQALIQELQNTKATLEVELQEKESHINGLQDAKTQVQAQLIEVEKEKSDLEKKLLDQNDIEQLKDEMRELQKYLTSLKKENAEQDDKYIALQQLSDRHSILLKEKQGLVTSLTSKVYSLDCKLTRADEELEIKIHATQDLETAKERCNILEKEIRAVREARQEESSQYDCKIQEKEELLKQKEAEISSLQEEVKKLLQQSTLSICNISQASVSETPKVKKEMTDHNKDIIALKEQVRQSETQNDSLIQEVNALKNQLEKMSVSDSSVVHCLNTKSSYRSILRDTSTSDVDSIATPALRERRGRKPRTPALTPSDSLHLVLDSSTATESHPNPLTSGGSTNTTKKFTRPQRISRRVTRRTTRDDSFEREDNPVASSNGEEDEVWEPSVPAKRAPRGTRKPRERKNKSQVANPHLNNQENKSILANKADDSQPSQDSDSGKTRVQRRKHQLYKSVADEPYQCSPSLIQPTEVADSPHTIVRRQLRNKKK